MFGLNFKYSVFYPYCMCYYATFNERQWELSNIYDMPSADEAAVPQRLCASVCLCNKKKFYSLLSLDRVHRSNIIAGNVTSSTCSERTSLPPVSLTEERRRQVRISREADQHLHTMQTGANKHSVVDDQIYWLSCLWELSREHIKTKFKVVVFLVRGLLKLQWIISLKSKWNHI